MANMQPQEGSSTSDASGGSSESTVQLNIKTLDSQIYSFHVDKNTVVSAFKEKIATECGVPVGQQRLIFRGKVLKDDHLLSEYNVENGDTLHLVKRQPQPSAGTNTGETASRQDATASHNRIGPIAHSVVLGTLNVGDAGEVVVPDLSQVIGAVLNSIEVGNQAGGMQPGLQTSYGNETEGSSGNAGSQSQDGSRSVPWQMTPPGAAIVLPSHNMPIPDSLNTLSEFMNRMELAFLQNGTEQSQSATASGDLQSVNLPMDSRGFPTVEALNIVLRHAQRLLSDHAIPALSQTASRLDQDGGSNDPAIREQVQTESVQLGVAMQHLGALFLELGRTILTLRMGQSPGQSFVNAGPAVYISPSGPNPIMVQPFPLQTSSLFGGSPNVAPNPAVGPVGVGGMPRNLNIHIHTGASLAPIISTVGGRAPNGVGMLGERVNGTDSGGPGVRISSGPALVSLSGAVQPVTSVPQASGSNPTSSIVAEINDQLRRNPTTNTQDQNRAPSEGSANQEQPGGHGARDEPSTSSRGGFRNRSSSFDDNPDGSAGVPLGLGLGGLQPKRRVKQTKSMDGAGSTSQNQRSSAVGPNADGPTDAAAAMSQILQSPSLDGLLAGVSQQTGVGSPDILRSMLQQLTQDPAMRNTMNQMAQQIDGHDLGGMFSGMDRGGQGGGGIDLGRMMQQMMPIVSQALGGGVSSVSAPNRPVLSASSSRRDMTSTNRPQFDLRQVVQRLESQSSPDEVFRSMVDRAVHLSSGISAGESVVNDLCSEGGLAQEFVEMLRRDISGRFQDEM